VNSYRRQQEEQARKQQASPVPQENLAVYMDEEYDDETDEFAQGGNTHVNARQVAENAIHAAERQ
jgi:hypothetical protein